MDDSEPKTIIAIFAHPDDELGAVGTLANHVERGDKVILAWTTKGELTTLFPDNPSEEEVKRMRVQHGEEIRKILGADSIKFFDMGDSLVEYNFQNRVEIAKFYADVKPDAIITWGENNSHSDHRITGDLALLAIQSARIAKVVEKEPHRKNVKFLRYWEKQSLFPTKFIDVTEVMDKVTECGNYYGEIYSWKSVEKWMKNSRISKGMESGVDFAEKFNIRFEFQKPPKYIL